MNPTIEEVKKVAEKLNMYDDDFLLRPSSDELQAFAQHYKEEGRKEQKVIDEVAAVRIKFPNPALLSHAEAHIWVMAAIAARDAIRNNTGE